MANKPNRLLMLLILTPCLVTDARHVPPIGLWPLNREHGLQDISGNGNHGNGEGVSFTSGVYGEREGAAMFTDGSYVEFDHEVRMKTEHSMTILAFVYPTGTAGPVVQILTEGKGVRFGQRDSSTLFMSLDKGDGTRLADLSARHALTLNSWNFIGATYSFSSGAVQLWHGGLQVASTVAGRAELAVGGTVRVGFTDEVGGSFHGKVACVQLYDVGLNQEQIEKAESECTGGNIALGKTASLSSSWPGLPASLAVDGYTSSVVTPSGDCVHTDREADPWFKVDLGGNYPVGRVRFYSRGECCGEHLTFPPPLSADNYASLRLKGNDTLDEFTLCFRLRTDSRVSGTIISYATSEQSNEILLYAINQHTTHHLFINSRYATKLDLGVLDGEWHHVCITWTSGRGLWNIYVDGQVKENGTRMAVGHRVPTNGIMVLGQDQDSLGGGFQKFQAYTGDLSGVNMWSRVLSPAEINDVMAGCQQGDVIGWRLGEWQVGGAVQSSPYRCDDLLTTLQVNVGEHFDMSENPECGRANNDLSLAEHGHVITIDCQEPIIGRYVTVQLVGRIDFLTLCEVEVFPATEARNASWIPADTSWPIDSSGTPYFDGVTVFDAAKVFDENTTTFWNPINLPFMYDSWNIVLDMQQSYWLYKIRVISPVEQTDLEEHHYPTSFELLVSNDVAGGDWSTVGTFSMSGRQTRAHGGFVAYSRYWKLLITSTMSGFQPYIAEVQLYGNTGTGAPFSSIEPYYECERNMSFYVTQSSTGVLSSGSTRYYSSDTVCSWTVTATENLTLALTFMTLDLADHDDCEFDYVAVHDGNSSAAPLLGRFCDAASTVTTTGSCMTVVFVTNSTAESTGFRATFHQVGDDQEISTVGFSTDPWTTEVYATTLGQETTTYETTTEIYPTDGRTTELPQTTAEVYPTHGGTTDAVEFTTGQDDVTTQLTERYVGTTESPVVTEEYTTDSIFSTMKETTHFVPPTTTQPDHTTTTVHSSTVTDTPTCEREGFEWNGTHCADVDECTRGDHTCPKAHTCLNADGSYWCFPCVAAVSVSGGGSNMSSALTVLRRFPLQLQAQLQLACKSDNYKLNYKWSAFQQKRNRLEFHLVPILFPASVETTMPELVIPKNVLSYGSVLLVINTTLTDERSDWLKMSQQAERWVRVSPSPLVADIVGGAARSVAEGSDIVLNASSSYDPDGMIHASMLNYTWSCVAGQQLEGNNHSKADLCDEVLNNGVSGPLQHINHTKLPPGETTFNFNVTVSYPRRQPVSYTQTLWIVEKGSPVVLISCQSNCNRRANPSERLVLVSTCSNCELDTGVSYNWTLVRAPTGFGRSDLNWDDESITGRHLPDLVVRSGVFTVRGNYVFRVEVSLEDGRRGFAEYSFETNEPPTVGFCTVTPSVGTAMVTAFSVTCSGFRDQDTPLTYSYLYSTGGERLASLSTTAGEMFSLLYSGTASTMAPQLLPVGQPSRDYNVTLKIRVSDALGATSSVKLYVQVNDLPAEEFAAVAGRLTSGEDSTLNRLVRTGDLQAVLQLSRSVSSVLNSARQNMTTAETESFTKIRTAMVAGLSKFQPSSVSSVNSLAGSLSQATRAPDQLSTETQVVASGVLSNMANFLRSLPAEDLGIEKVEESAVFMLTASINVITGSSHAVEKANRTGDAADQEKIQNVQKSTTSIFDAINTVNDLLLRGKIPNEKPTVFVQDQFQMSLSKQRCRNMGAQIVSTSGGAGETGSWFRIPDASVLFGEACFDSVGSENYQTTLNPFGYASNADMVKSSVAALQFRTERGALPVHNLTQPVEVVTPRKDGAVTVRTERAATAPIGHNLLTVHKFNVTGEGSVHITLQPDEDNATVRLYLRHQAPPTRSTFNRTFTLPQPSEQLYSIPIDDTKAIRADPYTVHIPMDEMFEEAGEGEYYLGVEYIQRNDSENDVFWDDTDQDIREHNVTLNYTIKIFSSKCLYFDVNTHLWKSDGCKVGPLTSESQTHCFCNHLTAFGSDFQFFVAPNSLNILEALKDFKNIHDNPAVVSTIGIIVGIYLLLILWGRKKDMDDAKKMGATILGTSTEGGGLYQIVVFTGTRSNSGTSAKVSIILYGDVGESGPYKLEDSNRLTFTRGGVDTFLVTTSLPLGALSHIHVWHDNFGHDSSWYLERIIVTDMQEDTRSIFVGDTWFAVEEGDGKVERVFPVATDEQLTRFRTLFSSRTSRDFRDGHLWYSVIGRPVHSTFTRVERISCCLSLLLCTMVTNIMFFGKGETYQRPPPLDIMGFQVQLPISWAEVIIGIESALLVFPVNLVIVQIFRHCAPRASRGQNKSGGCLLPWWFIFFAWFLVLGSCAASAFFTILYGFEYGREKAEAWLLTFLTSFFFDILITQPIKIVLIGLFIALIMKTPDAGVDYVPQTPLQDWKDLNPLMHKVPQNTAPPDSAELDIARERRFVEIGLRQALHDLAFYLLYILVLLVVANGNRDANMYHMTRNIENIFVSSFKGIFTPEGFWDYMKTSLPGKVGKTSWYNGDTFPLDGVLQDRVSYLVGPITLRQVRVSPGGACRVQEPFVDVVDHCTPPYTMWDKDEEVYDVGWLRPDPANGSLSTVDTTAHLSPWRYRRPSLKAAVPHPGKHGFYDGGGYVSELTNITEMSVTMAELESLGWIDHKTRAVFIEFIVYNPNCNLFSVFLLLAEFTAWGKVDTSVKATTVRLYLYTTTWSYVILGFQIIFVLVTFHYFFKEIRKILLLGSGYFKMFWNVVDLCVCMLSLAEIGVTLYTSYLLVDFNRPERQKTTQTTYDQYRQAASWYEINTYVLGCLVCVVTLKLLKLCLFNKFVERGAKVTKMAARPLCGFMLIFAIVFSSFAMLAFLLLGASLEGYSSYISTMQTMLQMMLGSFDYYDVEGAHGILGPTMLFGFLFFFNFIIILMFLAILDEAYHSVKNEERVQGKFINQKIADLAYRRFENLFQRRNSTNERKCVKDVPDTAGEENINFSSLGGENSASEVIYGKPHNESSQTSKSFFDLVRGWRGERRSSNCQIRLLHYRPTTDIEARDCTVCSDRSLEYLTEQTSTETRL